MDTESKETYKGKLCSQDDFCQENSGEESLSYPLFSVAQQASAAGERAFSEWAGEREKKIKNIISAVAYILFIDV